MKYLLSAFILFGFLVSMGCGSDETDPVDPEGARAKIDEANQKLEDAIMLLADILPNIQDPADLDLVDFNTPNALYREAIQLDPENRDGYTGASLTEVLKLYSDSEVRTARDDFVEYVEDSLSTLNKGLLKANGTVHTPFDFSGHPLLAPSLFVDKTAWAHQANVMSRVALNNPPLISEIQDIIERKLLTSIDFADDWLNVIEQVPDFTFTVTPRMQGDPDADPAELDMTEIKAFHGALLAWAGLLRIFNAYDFDINDYSLEGVVDALDRESTFFTLKSGQELSTARNNLSDGIDRLLEAIAFLRSETDNQDDDLIKIDTTGLTQSIINDIEDGLVDVQDALFGQVTIQDFPGNGDMLVVDIGTFFSNPIQNPKLLLPDYQMFLIENSCGLAVRQQFSELNFPDPTMNGIFPGMTDLNFKDIFDIQIDTLRWQTVNAVVDGQPFISCESYGFLSGFLFIEGFVYLESDSLDTDESVFITLNYTGPGTYPLGEIGTGNYGQFYRSTWDGVTGTFTSWVTNDTFNGSVTIVRDDGFGGALAGTFQFDAEEEFGTDVLSITSGNFYVHND